MQIRTALLVLGFGTVIAFKPSHRFGRGGFFATQAAGDRRPADANPALCMVQSLDCKTLESLNFDNKVLRSLQVDPIPGGPPRQVQGAHFARVLPTPVRNPTLVACSEEALGLLDLDMSELQRPDFAQYFSGNKAIPGADPAAHCYCGHQFGSFAGQLGDGATMYLGEVVNSKGERWELQFKGAGRTPFSRSADGRKVLRSSLREFLGSEAMHHLGVPTTRAGSCVTSDSVIPRDIRYDGNVIQDRTAASRLQQSRPLPPASSSSSSSPSSSLVSLSSSLPSQL